MPLTLVPTPIGNLEDITLRALRVLREADVIACEDTRTSSVLLKRYNIHKPLTSFHVHNENDKLPALMAKLKEGVKVAVISDAGTPGISDPGWILLKRAADEGIDVDVLPGASAVIPAVLLSGLRPQPFLFAGFPPEKNSERLKFFETVKNLKCSLCFYVSPHKAVKDISDMIEILGDRESSLVREISKLHQETIRGRLSVILEKVATGVKGELVLIVDGADERVNDDWKEKASAMIDEGMSVRDIAEEITSSYSVPKNEIRKYIISVKEQ